MPAHTIPPLTAERLRNLLDYDPETGLFRWRVSRGSRAPVGKRAGTLDQSTGYIQIMIDRRIYYAHRLVWLHVHGRWPTKEEAAAVARAERRKLFGEFAGINGGTA